MFSLKKCLLRNLADPTDIILSVNQSLIVSKYIDFVLTTGFIPYLIPNLWKSFQNKRKNVTFIDNVSPNLVININQEIILIIVVIITCYIY